MNTTKENQKRWEGAKTMISGGAVVVSVALSIIMISLSDSPGTDPFSAVGENNRILFFAWGFSTGLAVYMNLRLLARRLQVKSKFFEIALAIGCSMALVTTSIVGMQTLMRIIHVSSAAIFGLVCTMCVLAILIIKLKKKGKQTSVPYITALAIAGIVFIIATIYAGWFTAYTQILLANVCLVTMFCSNYIEKWTVETTS